MKVPVSKPLLPVSQDILPYLQQIDKNQFYSNFGPLVLDLHKRMGEVFGLTPDYVLTMSSGTTALSNTVRAYGFERGTYCIVPSWTFAASAAAAVAAGLIPYFVDVDAKTQVLTTDILKAVPKEIMDKTSLIMAVGAFGSMPDVPSLLKFTRETGKKIIIDAAACFDLVSKKPKEYISEEIPVIVSLHATKTFGCGEGGLILCKDKELIVTIRQMSNFGFIEGRQIVLAGTNGKMSEFGAAVAHAELDCWPEKLKKWNRVRDMYMDKLSRKGIRSFFSKDWVAASTMILIDTFNNNEIVDKLNAKGIECRKWWMNGCHDLIAYRKYPRADLPNTIYLSKNAFSIPFFIEMTEEQIDYVVNTLADIMEGK